MDILQIVKDAQGITGEYHDNTLKIYIEEVKEYLMDAGIQENVIESGKANGTIARGVIDLWNYGTGQLSSYFKERATQLSYKE